MAVPFESIRFYRKGSPRRLLIEIKAFLEAAGEIGHLIVGTQDMLLKAENTAETYDRQYSDGMVIAKPRRSGRSFNIDLMLYQESVFENLLSLEADFISASNANKMQLEYDVNGLTHSIDNVVLESINLEEQSWGKDNDIVVARFFFSSMNP